MLVHSNLSLCLQQKTTVLDELIQQTQQGLQIGLYFPTTESTNMRSERKARISGLAGTEYARNRTLPDLTFPVTE